MINQSKADWFHIDVMDGLFVPNISFGFPIVKHINLIAKKPLDVHLMIVNPDKYIKDFKDLGANIITVHYEACTHLHRTIALIKSLNIKAGVAINPHTPVSVLSEVLDDINLVCIMSVNPGFGGQSFIERSFKKVTELDRIRNKNNYDFLIEVDGGVNNNNAKKLIERGADVLVAGNFIFKSENPTKTIENLKLL